MHVIFGAGPVGSGTARRLAAAGRQVRVVTRSGSGPEGVERVAADAADPDAVAKVTAGADVVYNCVNPPSYDTWVKDWPPVAANLLAAAEDTGAVLVTMSNLYGYGPVDHPMREDDPLASTETKGRIRATMWADALAAHRAGRVRATEVRASDFFGPTPARRCRARPAGATRRRCRSTCGAGRGCPARARSCRRARAAPPATRDGWCR